MMMLATRFSTFLMMVLMAYPAVASDERQLADKLDAFLAASHTESAHTTFWSDDLIYTSSSGLRFGKAAILAGFEGEEASSEPPAVIYSAEDVDIRLHGDMAIVAFRLVGTPNDESSVRNYFNTGTFKKMDGQWRAIAWQATIILPDDIQSDE